MNAEYEWGTYEDWGWRQFRMGWRAYVWALATVMVCKVLGHKPEKPFPGGNTLTEIMSEGQLRTICMRCGLFERRIR